MATRAERFKSEQAKEHARQHAQPTAAATSAARNGGANGKDAAKIGGRTTKAANKKAKAHVRESTPLTSRELLLNMSPSARHQRRT
jgi:hypothetical protein